MRREAGEERINDTTSCELHGCRSHYTAAWILRHHTWLGAQPTLSRAIVIASIKDDERVVADACHELIEVARLPMATDLCND
jgi:1,2-phenylacetyl-CoA epoxidase catalytic subunit